MIGDNGEKPDTGRFKIAVPREHGLIVVWINTMIISIVAIYRFSPFAITTFLLMIATFFLYDPVLSALRIWKTHRDPLKFLSHNHLYVLIIGPAILAWLIFTASIEVLPLVSLVLFFFFVGIYMLLFRYGERKLYTRIFSILTLTSMFLIISTSFNHAITIRQLEIFMILSIAEALLGSGPVEIVNSRITKVKFQSLFVRRILPVYAASLILLTPVILTPFAVAFYAFLAILTAAALSNLLIRDLPIKQIGYVAAGFNFVVLVSLLIIFR
jgi:hypothetical protein